MKFYLILMSSAFMLSAIYAKAYLPDISNKYGPLYHSIRVLLLNGKQNADLAWNDVQHHIDEKANLLRKAFHQLHDYEAIIREKLYQINSLDHFVEVKMCYKQYERQIARFNRDLLKNYLICKQALNVSLSQLKTKIEKEIKYIRDAAVEIQDLMYVCNVTNLRGIGEDSRHASIMLCVLTNLGEIDQRMLEAAQVVFYISNTFAGRGFSPESFKPIDNDGDDDVEKRAQENKTNICLDIQYLRDEFETIYENVMLCVKEIEYK